MELKNEIFEQVLYKLELFQEWELFQENNRIWTFETEFLDVRLRCHYNEHKNLYCVEKFYNVSSKKEYKISEYQKFEFDDFFPYKLKLFYQHEQEDLQKIRSQIQRTYRFDDPPINEFDMVNPTQRLHDINFYNGQAQYCTCDSFFEN